MGRGPSDGPMNNKRMDQWTTLLPYLSLVTDPYPALLSYLSLVIDPYPPYLLQPSCRIQLRSTRSPFNSLSDDLSGTSSSLSPWPDIALLLPLQGWSQQPTLTIKPTPCYFQRRSHLIHLRPLSMLLTLRLLAYSVDSQGQSDGSVNNKWMDQWTIEGSMDGSGINRRNDG